MKSILRVLAVLVGIPALTLPVIATWSIVTRGATTDKLAALVLVIVLSVVGCRAAAWLWSVRPFWMDAKRLAEVSLAFAGMILLAEIARRTQAHPADVATYFYLAAVIAMIVLYALLRLSASFYIRGLKKG